MPNPTAVILVVGLNESLIGDACPRLRDFAKANALRRVKPVLPAVTCSVQASMLTGAPPAQHGIVGNGWYHRDLAEVRFWHRSGELIRGEKLWDAARRRDPEFTCANLFWRYAAYGGADYVVIERPIYKADGRKLPDCYAEPYELRDELQSKLGVFPLFRFWGPATSIASSRWIAAAAMHVYDKVKPTLSLVYIPHLDYCLQKLGPSHADIPKHLGEMDTVVSDLLDFYQQRGVQPIIVSEYGIEEVDDAVHINRMFREEGLLRVREEQGGELLDAGASAAFAVADHQVAHVYVRNGRDPTEHGVRVQGIAELCRHVPGVEHVLDREAQREAGLAHERGGDLVLVAEPRRWFSYQYWLDDARVPDFARTVDIHNKPGYDPLEMFLDPALTAPKLRIAWRLFQKKVLKQRALLDVIPLDTKLVRGSHGRVEQAPDMQPLLIAPDASALPDGDELPCTSVRDVVLGHVFGASS